MNKLWVLLLVSLISCQPTEVVKQENQYLKSVELVQSLEANEFKSQVSNIFGANTEQILLFVQSGLDQYKITYKTKNIFGEEVLASGALVIPTDLDHPMAMASLHHGTLFNEQDAPSYFNIQTEATLGSFLASTGIIIGMPDYIGYGASKNQIHPYEHNKGLAIANVDFIRAMKEFVLENDINWNNNLMLTGYSEGGYANMATHKLIEENHANEFNVTVSVSGAGAYNKTATFDKLINETGSSAIPNNQSYVWVIQVYNEAYHLDKPMSYYFKEPFATDIENNGHSVAIEVSLNEILTSQFIQDYNDGTFPDLNLAIKDNDIHDWRPKAITRLYHGDADQYVPYLNSKTAEQAMTNKGAENVELHTVSGGTHGSSLSAYFLGLFELFTIHKSD